MMIRLLLPLMLELIKLPLVDHLFLLSQIVMGLLLLLLLLTMLLLLLLLLLLLSLLLVDDDAAKLLVHLQHFHYFTAT